ncbi:hypothetical protein H8356DRAFT_1280108 [Neocallimastix lanati (nom. inval.)]|uniref:Biogenesis of lysosome-related organelles complex 1 subunit KXD1 n=1 Tax=Neocallimastix californiae TaxID=1754190 RepID=A0A1Y2EWH7_9FUNG|nr:hypothetical protein H8356DRAFT_1280108 [Neocallimastix sp. JGI-2020a]ORY75918.1 hypothetical protein LY90DRAFT_502033 [Neocallimastix californiae]|eukprot:ORY75918.1 hypothetical protein LY90DRAFT_502033 [Neocallimastix californiae]
MTKDNNNSEIELTANFQQASVYSKLRLLSDCIRDLNQESESIRSFINTVSNEITVTNDKIQNYLAGNAKRLDLLKELNNKLYTLDYKRRCYTDEYMELVPLKFIKERYDPNVLYNNK